MVRTRAIIRKDTLRRQEFSTFPMDLVIKNIPLGLKSLINLSMCCSSYKRSILDNADLLTWILNIGIWSKYGKIHKKITKQPKTAFELRTYIATQYFRTCLAIKEDC